LAESSPNWMFWCRIYRVSATPAISAAQSLGLCSFLASSAARS
jgi:hypothetical protein